MSEFLAEARILVRPDTTRFRAELEAALAAATAKPITIPVVPVAATGLGAATAETAAFTSAQTAAAAETQVVAAALEKETVAAREATVAQAAHARSTAQLARGAAASGLSLFGLRGATLAASGAFLAGTAAVVAFSRAVHSAASLQTELNVFRVTAGATADEMVRVSAEAKALGRDLTLPGVTANDAAVALTTLSKAGLTVQDSLDGARGALELATAAQIDNVTATNLIADALNSFALSGSEAVRVADLLTGAAKESQGEISDMGTALAQASAVAHLAGVSIEDTVTFLTQLAKAGISGGRAGTSLRVAFLRLINPTAAAAKELDKLNVAVRDSQGNIRPQIFTDLAQALDGLGKTEAQKQLATIFGTDAVRAAAIIGAQGAASFDTLRASVTEAGLAQEQASARTSGLQGSVENLKNQVDALGTSVGEVTLGPLTGFVTKLADATSGVGGAIEAFKRLRQEFDKKFDFNIPGTEETGNSLANRLIKVGEAATPLNFTLELLARTGKQFGDNVNQVVTPSLEDLQKQIEAIIAAGKQTGGDLGLNQILVSLDLLSAKLRQGPPEAQKLATAIAQLRTRIQQTSGLKIFPDDVHSLFPPALLTGSVAKEAGETNLNALKNALLPSRMFVIGAAAMDALGAGIQASAVPAAKKAKAAAENIVNTMTEELAKAGEAFDVARAAGNDQAELAALRREADVQKAIRDAADARAEAIGAGNKGFATAVAERRKAQAALASVNEQIRSQEDQAAAAAKQSSDKTTADANKAAADAAAAASKREQALLSAFGLARDQRQNAIAKAAQTAGLEDDIDQQKKLKTLVLKQIAQIRERISVEGGRAAAITALRAILTQIDASQKALIKQQQDARAAQRAALLEGINLDIGFDQTTENTKKEIADRKRLIAALRVQQSTLKAGTNAYKEIRNQIAEQNKAIADLTAEKKKQNTGLAAAQAQFGFLQAQQGFAANLLGNLIPGTATSGLVGGGSPVQAALTPVAGAADARGSAGFTAGQGNAITSVLHQMLQQLKILNGSQATPEAVRQIRIQHSALDGIGGG